MIRRVVVMLLCAVTMASPAMALSQKDLAEVRRVEHYLNTLDTIVADFSQVAPDGSLASGTFYLSRPGKMRWQYAPPTPVLMVMNGSTLVYYDHELEQVSHIPVDDTMASFLARDTISLTDGFVSVTKIDAAQGILRLTMMETNKPEAGTLTLELSNNPLQLRNMIVTDTQGQTTTVALNNARYGEKLAKKLFVFKDPRGPRHLR